MMVHPWSKSGWMGQGDPTSVAIRSRRKGSQPSSASIKLLWAPWRVEYFKEKKVRGCILCRILRETRDKNHLILHRGTHSFVVLNKYPYTSGHLMVSPKRHLENLETLTDVEVTDLMNSLKLSIYAIKHAMKPHGFNIGANIGRVAGAGIVGHIHFHVVPRWNGDTNFMPVISETKVVPEHLKSSYKRLKKYFSPV